MNTKQSYFELFGLDEQFDIDRSSLSERYRDAQRQAHPDRFAAADSHQQRLAVQYSAFINQAYDTLKHPVARARYLLELRGVEVENDRSMQSDTEFLLQQMQWREELAEIREHSDPEAAIDAFLGTIKSAMKSAEKQFVTAFDAGELQQAKHILDKLQFVQKLIDEAEQLEASLFDV